MIRLPAWPLVALLLSGAALHGQEAKPATAATIPATPKPAAETEEAPAKPETPAVAPVAEADLKAAEKLDAVTIPTPGELLAAVNKLGTPDWSSTFRPPIPTSYSSRAQTALNLGGLIADGFIAVEAKDKQQVKNVGKDVMALAKPLGVQQDVLNRGKSLTDFADADQWDSLKEELEATQNEVKAALLENRDEEMVVLVTLGGWIRGVEAMSSYIGKNYTVEGAALLRQPAVARYLKDRVSKLSDKTTDDPAVKKARSGLGQIEKAVNFSPEKPPSAPEVQELSGMTARLLRELAARKTK